MKDILQYPIKIELTLNSIASIRSCILTFCQQNPTSKYKEELTSIADNLHEQMQNELNKVTTEEIFKKLGELENDKN